MFDVLVDLRGDADGNSLPGQDVKPVPRRDEAVGKRAADGPVLRTYPRAVVAGVG